MIKSQMVLKIGTPIKCFSEFSAIDLGMIKEVLDSLLQLLIASLCIFYSIYSFVDHIDVRELVTLGNINGCSVLAKKEDLFE